MLKATARFLGLVSRRAKPLPVRRSWESQRALPFENRARFCTSAPLSDKLYLQECTKCLDVSNVV